MEKKRQDDQRKHTALEIILFFMYRKLRSGYKKRSARMHTRAVVLVQRERLCYSKKRCVSAVETCRHSGKPKCTCTAEERIIRGILQQ